MPEKQKDFFSTWADSLKKNVEASRLRGECEAYVRIMRWIHESVGSNPSALPGEVKSFLRNLIIFITHLSSSARDKILNLMEDE